MSDVPEHRWFVCREGRLGKQCINGWCRLELRWAHPVLDGLRWAHPVLDGLRWALMAKMLVKYNGWLDKI